MRVRSRPVEAQCVGVEVIIVVIPWLAAPAAALAQTPSPPSSTGSTAASKSEQSSRPATASFLGDTGLWFVHTTEVLPNRRWSASLYRRGPKPAQGYTSIGNFAATVAVGVASRWELFASVIADVRVNRDARPV